MKDLVEQFAEPETFNRWAQEFAAHKEEQQKFHTHKPRAYGQGMPKRRKDREQSRAITKRGALAKH